MNDITEVTQRDVTDRLSRFWLPHLVACEDLSTHLGHVDRTLKDIRVEALRGELSSFDDLLAQDIPDGWRFKEYRKRTIVTLAGEITYKRRIYTEPSGICHALLDEVLGIRTRFKLAPDAFLWIAKTASDISYRKTAKAFSDLTGAQISHWLVMAVVHEEGALILEECHQQACRTEKSDAASLISQETLFVEFDGIHIPLQKTGHGPLRPRWEYERDRERHDFELKVATVYAGKDKRRRRAGIIEFCADEPAACFWPLLSSRIGHTYDVGDIRRVHTSADAAGWCKNNGLDLGVSGPFINHHLDRFHLNREIRRAFGRTKQASHFIALAYAKRAGRLARDLQLVINHAKSSDKRRYLKLQVYIHSNLELIAKGAGPSMGTMEGTNAHVYAARLKCWGGAWSRHGASSMALIRARIASGLPLIAPKVDNAVLDDSQIRRRRRYEESLLGGSYDHRLSVGHGYEPPHGSIALTTRMASHLYGILEFSP